MKLFKNVDICDLESILAKGILPAAECGNHNWISGKRADNADDVVYLHDAKDDGSFVRYGAALVEVEVEDAKENELSENDVNRGLYTEYVTRRVPAESIVSVWVPEQILDKAPKDARVRGCRMTAEVYGADGLEEAKPETLNQFFKTANTVCSGGFNYFRGEAKDRRIFDLYNVKYIRA